MRILFVSHYQLPHFGGIEFVVDELARALTARGHEVAVVSSDAGAGHAPPEVPYRSLRVPAHNGLERRFGVPYPLFAPRLVGVLRREVARADVVHAQGWLYQGTVAAFALARRRGAIRVLSEHVAHVPYSSALLDRAETLAEATIGRYCARSADALVLLNEKVREEVSARAPGRPVAVIANGTDMERCRPPEPGERERLRAGLGWNGGPRVLFAGRPVAKKGFDVAVEAARRAGDAFRLVVVGPESLPPGMPDGVELLGPLPPQRLAEVYRACDAIVMPSRPGEGLPLTTQEAMASALPIVMTDDPGYRGLVSPGGPAVRLLPLDAGAMAGALKEAVRVRDERPQDLDAMVRYARSAFSWDHVADEHEALYRRLGAP
jgi:glycosyltransferase involved in cell wall biosynthesis